MITRRAVLISSVFTTGVVSQKPVFALSPTDLPSTAVEQSTGENGSDNARHGHWSKCADMPFAVQEIYPTKTQIGGEQHIINAGGIATGLTYPVKRKTILYNPITNSWREGASLPKRRHHISLASVNGDVYAIGGFTNDKLAFWKMCSDVWRISDPVAGEWEPAPALPRPQAEASCLAVNEKIHFIGGRQQRGEANKGYLDHTDTDNHLVFDTKLGTWEQRTPLPTARNSSGFAELNGEIYVISGRTVSDGNTPVCEVYNPIEDRWRTIAPLPKSMRPNAPQGQGGTAAASFNGKVYCFGGEWFGQMPGVYPDAWEYDPQSDHWRAVQPMIRPRHGLGAVTLNDGIYLLGGASGPSSKGVTAYLDRFVI
ncbi:MAG: galactose oxidase [Pseudomonadota bacterium]